MSQGEALLNSLTDEQIAAYSAGSEGEPHVIVGDDRFIMVPDSLKRVAVQYDHDVETVTFDCPRYWDDLDMSKMAVYINYMRSDKYTDSYPVNDISVEGDIMHFSWTISRNVTEIPGHISFLICIKKTDTDGNESNHWNSELCTDMYVSEGMETDEQPMDLYPDVVTEVLLRMSHVEEIAVTYDQVVAARNRAETAASDAAATKESIDNSAAEIRNSYANAVKKHKSGAIVAADDVSPVEHDVKVKIPCKNLFNILSPADTQSTYRGWLVNPAGETMTLSITDKDTSVDIEGLYLGFSMNGYSANGGARWMVNAGNITEYSLTKSDMPYISVYPPTDEAVTKISNRFNIQLETGDTATEYEPYIDPSTVTVTGCGKNLAYNNTISITGTVGTSGSVGALENSILVKDIPIKKDVSYVISMTKPDKITNPRVFLYNGLLRGSTHTNAYNELVSGGRGVEKNVLSGAIVNTEGYEYMAITIGGTSAFTQGESINGIVSNLQLEIGTVATTYEPYSGSTATPGADGVCTVKSVSPNMTVFTNNPGVTVDVEYNQDQHKVLGDISAALDHIIEIQNSILGEN
jgi:hypothetical protein